MASVLSMRATPNRISMQLVCTNSMLQLVVHNNNNNNNNINAFQLMMS